MQRSGHCPVPDPNPTKRRSTPMKLYLLSLGAGVLVGVIYSLINVRSPAPPLIALLGLLGMLGGEQVIPVAKRLLSGTTLSAAWRDAHCTKPRLRHVAGPSGFRTGATRDDRPRGTPLMTTSHPVPDLVLRNGRFTTLDRANPIATAVAIRDGTLRCRRRRCRSRAARRPDDARHRPEGPTRAAWPDRQPPAHHPRRPELQHGAALGRRALAWPTRWRMLEAPGRGHAAAAMGARGRRLHRAPVRREAAADDRGAERRRARHAGLHPAPLRPRAAQRARRCARSATRKDTPEPPGGEIVRDAARQPDRPAARQAQRRRSSTRRWPRARSCRSTTSSTRRATSCAS